MYATENITRSGTAERNTMLKVAVAYMRRLNERRAAYDAECEYHARRGHRPHYCIHGTNQWTDYDNICGPCEEGYTDQETALGLAHHDVRQWINRMALVHTMLDHSRIQNDPVPYLLAGDLMRWASESLQVLEDHPRPRRTLP